MSTHRAAIVVDVQRAIDVLRMDVEDLVRRKEQGLPPALTLAAARAAAGASLRVLEMAAQLAALDADGGP